MIDTEARSYNNNIFFFLFFVKNNLIMPDERKETSYMTHE